MASPPASFKDLTFIDNIHTIVDIGPSPKRNYFFIRTAIDSFKGKIFAVKPGTKMIEGYPQIPVFERITDIPADEPVDFAFVEVIREKVPEIIRQCVTKGVKLVAIFSTNFADEGTEEGRRLQEEVVKAAQGKIRIIGPNGMGLYISQIGLRWRRSLPWNPGSVGIVAQSGGLSNLLIQSLSAKKIYISKAFSIGNAVDVNLLDVLNYYQNDPTTSIIVCYIEGLPTGTGRQFLSLVKSSKKPIVILKAGRTSVGAKAALTHTASLVGNFTIWRDAIRQINGILVETLEDAVNTVSLLQAFGRDALSRISRVALVSLSGGYAALCSDALSSHGFELPAFSSATREKLQTIVIEKGTSFNNPIDIAVMIYFPEKVEQMLIATLQDDAIDCVVLELCPLYFAYPMRPSIDMIGDLVKAIQNAIKLVPKSLVVIVEDLEYEDIQKALRENLANISVPVFSDILPICRSLQFLTRKK